VDLERVILGGLKNTIEANRQGLTIAFDGSTMPSKFTIGYGQLLAAKKPPPFNPV
jgi:hypothetical protein